LDSAKVVEDQGARLSAFTPVYLWNAARCEVG